MAFWIDSCWKSFVRMHKAIVRAHLHSGFVGPHVILITGKPDCGSSGSQLTSILTPDDDSVLVDHLKLLKRPWLLWILDSLDDVYHS